jgi:hypothetical protein
MSFRLCKIKHVGTPPWGTCSRCLRMSTWGSWVKSVLQVGLILGPGPLVMLLTNDIPVSQTGHSWPEKLTADETAPTPDLFIGDDLSLCAGDEFRFIRTSPVVMQGLALLRHKLHTQQLSFPYLDIGVLCVPMDLYPMPTMGKLDRGYCCLCCCESWQNLHSFPLEAPAPYVNPLTPWGKDQYLPCSFY